MPDLSDADAAYARAQEIIAEALDTGATGLDLSGERFGEDVLSALDRLPPEIADCTALHWLNLADTQVTDLRPLQSLTALQSLDLIDTQVSDLRPLQNLTALQSLYLTGTQVTDLRPLQFLTTLLWLDLQSTEVTDLQPLQSLTALQSLFLHSTQVTDLRPLQRLTALQSLNLQNTQVTDLQPLQRLAALKGLDLWGTQVTDLHPLQSLAALKGLNLQNTQVTDLRPIRDLPKLDGTGDMAGLRFHNTPATKLDPELARLSEIEDDAERTQSTLAYLRDLTDWPPLPQDPQDVEPQTPTALRFLVDQDERIDTRTSPSATNYDPEILEIHPLLLQMTTALIDSSWTPNLEFARLNISLKNYLSKLGANPAQIADAAALWAAGRALKSALEADDRKTAGQEEIGETPKLNADQRADLAALWEMHLIFTETVPRLAEFNRRNLDPAWASDAPDVAETRAAMESLSRVITESAAVTETAAADIAAAVADAGRQDAEASRSYVFGRDSLLNFLRQLTTQVIKIGAPTVAAVGGTIWATSEATLSAEALAAIQSAEGLLLTAKPFIQTLLAGAQETTAALQSALHSLWIRLAG